MKFIKYLTLLIFLSKSSLYADWAIPFNIKNGSTSTEMSIDFTTWFFKIVTALICSFLLIKSGSHLKSEQYSGAFLAFLGAVIVAIAPEILKSMFYNV